MTWDLPIAKGTIGANQLSIIATFNPWGYATYPMHSFDVMTTISFVLLPLASSALLINFGGDSYGLATNLNSQLDDLSHSLSSMIETVNALSVPADASANSTSSSPFAAAGSVDPIVQIEAILNAHLGSLQWIDNAVKELEVKVKEVEAQQENGSSSDGYSSASYGYTGRGFGLGPARR